MINLICACDQNRLIGAKQRLPWHLSAELNYFYQHITHACVVVGRKSFHHLPPRLHRAVHTMIVMTRDIHYKGDHVIHAVADIEPYLKKLGSIWVIGGGEVYETFLPYAHRLYITEIHAAFAGDTYFPSYRHLPLKELSRIPTAENGISFDFTVYENTAVQSILI